MARLQQVYRDEIVPKLRKELGIEAATPMEQAYPLLFLCSAAASAISGVTLITDSGYIMSGITETYPSATPMARLTA